MPATAQSVVPSVNSSLTRFTLVTQGLPTSKPQTRAEAERYPKRNRSPNETEEDSRRTGMRQFIDGPNYLMIVRLRLLRRKTLPPGILRSLLEK